MKTIIVCMMLLLFCGCTKSHLYVQQEQVDASSLASSYIGSPDERQKDPPVGQRLLVGWNFPKSLFDQKLQLMLTVRFWDHMQEVIEHLVAYKTDSKAFFFKNSTPNKDHRILTYRIDVVNGCGEVIEVWEHQFWTKLIDVDQDH